MEFTRYRKHNQEALKIKFGAIKKQQQQQEPFYLDGDFYLMVLTGTKFTDVVHDDHPSFLYCLMEWE